MADEPFFRKLEEIPWLVDSESDNFASLHRVRQVLSQVQGSRVQVVELEELGKTLLLDGRVQAAESDEHIFHEMLVHPAMTWTQAERVLVLGGGNGCIVRELLKWPCLERVLVIEPDDECVRLCRVHFPEWAKSLEDPRVELVHREFSSVLQLDETFDLILADVEETDSSFFSLKVLEHVEDLLEFGGLFVAQTGGMRLGRSSLDPTHVRLVNLVREVFSEVRVGYEYVPSFNSMWTATVASSCGFCGQAPELSQMWHAFEKSVWAEINLVLDDNDIVTAYYDGITHMRTFSPPVDQSAVYGWPVRDDEPCHGCNKDKDDEGRAD
jgi:spermidine synthase